MLQYTLFDRFENGYALKFGKALPEECKSELTRICNSFGDPNETTFEAFAIRMEHRKHTYISVVHRIPGAEGNRAHNRVITVVVDDREADAIFHMPFRMCLRKLMDEHVPALFADGNTSYVPEDLLALVAGAFLCCDPGSDQVFVELQETSAMAVLEEIWNSFPYQLRKHMNFCVGMESGAEARGCSVNFAASIEHVRDIVLAGKTDKHYFSGDDCHNKTKAFNEVGKQLLSVMKGLPCKDLFMEAVKTHTELMTIIQLAGNEESDSVRLAKALSAIDTNNLCAAVKRARLKEEEWQLLLSVSSVGMPQVWHTAYKRLCEEGKIPAETLEEVLAVTPKEDAREKPVTETVKEETVYETFPQRSNGARSMFEKFKEENGRAFYIIWVIEILLLMTLILISYVSVKMASAPVGQIVYIAFTISDTYQIAKLGGLMILSFILGLLIRTKNR